MEAIQTVLCGQPGRQVQIRQDTKTGDFYAYIVEDNKDIVYMGLGKSVRTCLNKLNRNIMSHYEYMEEQRKEHCDNYV